MFNRATQWVSGASSYVWNKCVDYYYGMEETPPPPSTSPTPSNTHAVNGNHSDLETNDLYQFIKQYAQTLETTCLTQLEKMLDPAVYQQVIAINGYQTSTSRYASDKQMQQQEPAVFYYQHTID